ncbi:hypothetical protein Vadar_034341 [Vaccinium darrowii]|uniref:Uncharacterized protein n=1 Tax=Vaccinium darrowii TaxID=229202 RepID=A0ACB7YHX1_9ERIC|nr:hypothetical protein Vadar_034341 [Vaccinium darrowii]
MSSTSTTSRFQGPLCGCGVPAPLRSSNQDPNRGRRFFGCINYKQATACGFFLWLDPERDMEKEFIQVENQVLKREDLVVIVNTWKSKIKSTAAASNSSSEQQKKRAIAASNNSSGQQQRRATASNSSDQQRATTAAGNTIKQQQQRAAVSITTVINNS